MPGTSVPAKLPFIKSHAFLIGIDDYKHVTPLKTAEQDARLIGHQLEKHHGFTTHYLLGKEASLKAIRRLLNETIPELAKESPEGPNRIIVYFAGHGYAKDGDGKPEGFLVPCDAEREGVEKLLPMKELNEALKEDKIKCKHGLLILDCCFAGAFQWSSQHRHGGFVIDKTINQNLFDRFTRDSAWQVITSSASDQKAADLINHLSLGHRDDGEWKDSPFVQAFEWEDFKGTDDQPIDIRHHSPFALALFIALLGEGDRILKGGRGDGIITAGEMHNYLRHWVEKVTFAQKRRQTPMIINLPRHDKGEFIFLHPSHPAFLPPDPGRNPYLGLSPYTEEDEPFFFGRDKVVEELVLRIKKESLVVLSGPSGSGKTSIVQAGIVPALKSEDWMILDGLTEDGQGVVKALKNLPVTKKALLIIDSFEGLLETSPDDLSDWENYLIEQINNHANLSILILVRTSFELYYSSTKPLTDLSDNQKKWWALWESGQYRLPPLSKGDLYEIIVQPARQVVLFFESEKLINELINNVYLAPGAMPLLSYFLSTLYQTYVDSRRTDRTFTTKDFEAIGGLIGALQKKATAVFNAATPAKKMMIRFVLLRMVKLDNGQLTRRKVPIVRLDKIPADWQQDEFHVWSYISPEGKVYIYHELDFPNDTDDELLNDVIRQLEEEEKLLVITKDEKTEQLYIEPIHNALITFWPLAQEWFRTVGTDTIQLQRQLWQSVKEHQFLQEQPAVIQVAKGDTTKEVEQNSLLWDSNPKLLQVTAAIIGSVIYEKNHLISPKAPGNNHFLEEEVIHNLSKEDKSVYESIKSAYEIEEGNSDNNIKLFSVLSRLEADLAILIIQQKQQWLNQAEVKFLSDSWNRKEARIKKLIRERNEALALAREANAAALAAKAQMLKEKDPTTGLNLAYAAYLTLSNTETINALNSLSTAGPYYQKILKTEFESQITALAFSPIDSNQLAAASLDGLAKIWNIHTGECLQIFDDNKGRILTKEESPDGEVVSTDWNHGIITMSFSKNGEQLIIGCKDGSTVVWDVITGDSVMRIEAPKGQRHELANYTFAHFSTEKNTVITIDRFRTIEEWKNPEKESIWKFTLPDSIYLQNTNVCTAVSKSGQFIALGQRVMEGIYEAESKLLLMDRKQEDTLIDLLIPAGTTPNVMCFNAEETKLYVGFSSGCVSTYDLPSGKETMKVEIFSKSITALELSTEQGYLYVASEDYDVKKWNTHKNELSETFSGAFEEIYAITVSKENQYLVHNRLNDIVLWSLDQGEEQIKHTFHTGRTVGSYTGKQAPAQMIVSPDRKTIACVHYDSGTPFYEFLSIDGQPLLSKNLIRSNLGLQSAAFSPDGQCFLAAHKAYNGVHKDKNNLHIYQPYNKADNSSPTFFSSAIIKVNRPVIAVSNDADFILIADYHGKQIAFFSLREEGQGKHHKAELDIDSIEEIILTRDQKQFIIRASDHLEVWSIKQGYLAPKAIFDYKGIVPKCVAISDDGTFFVAAYTDASVILWKMSDIDHSDSQVITTFNSTFTGHSEPIIHLDISEDGQFLLTGSKDGTVRIWDIKTNETIQIIESIDQSESSESSAIVGFQSAYEISQIPVIEIEMLSFIEKDRYLLVGYSDGSVIHYPNHLYHWPGSCYKLSEAERASYKISTDIKLPD